jgi:putative colanic acid biosynthesis glycosyltransferase
MTEKAPFFSIVTVCFKDRLRLSNTIHSVRQQIFRDFEYIVIDGGSNDGTSDEVNAAGSLIAKFISESDRGIYDAMNKGLALATGSYVLFLNAGDLLSDEQALERCQKNLGDGLPTGLICPVFVKYPGSPGVRLAKVKNFRRPWMGLPTSHQGLIYRLDVLKNYPFDISIKLAADFDQFLRVTRDAHENFRTMEQALSIVEAGGVSDLRRGQSRAEYKKLIIRHLAWPGKETALAYQALLSGYDLLAERLKAILPKKIVHVIRMWK